MKTFLLVSTLLTLSTAASAVPNLYTCKSEDGRIKLGYTTTSFTGHPTLEVMIDGKSVAPADEFDTDIVVDRTVLGSLVSLVTNKNFLADAPSKVYSFLVPDLAGDVNTGAFESQLLISAIGGFRGPNSPMQTTNKSAGLTCKASKVFF